MSELREFTKYLWDHMNWGERILTFVIQPAILLFIIVVMANGIVKAARSDIPSHRCPVCNRACD